MLCPSVATFGGELIGLRVSEASPRSVVQIPNINVSTLAVAQVALACGRTRLPGATASRRQVR